MRRLVHLFFVLSLALLGPASGDLFAGQGQGLRSARTDTVRQVVRVRSSASLVQMRARYLASRARLALQASANGKLWRKDSYSSVQKAQFKSYANVQLGKSQPGWPRQWPVRPPPSAIRA